mmetsp:Transcript_79667/g.221688  ORF Transcript_79667/g.221688 Transcript_79667/m.221688 type:complete len:266 (-) Transcript_79667:72-869(-)
MVAAPASARTALATAAAARPAFVVELTTNSLGSGAPAAGGGRLRCRCASSSITVRFTSSPFKLVTFSAFSEIRTTSTWSFDASSSCSKRSLALMTALMLRYAAFAPMLRILTRPSLRVRCAMAPASAPTLASARACRLWTSSSTGALVAAARTWRRAGDKGNGNVRLSPWTMHPRFEKETLLPRHGRMGSAFGHQWESGRADVVPTWPSTCWRLRHAGARQRQLIARTCMPGRTPLLRSNNQSDKDCWTPKRKLDDGQRQAIPVN